jgi:hypothetical protein
LTTKRAALWSTDRLSARVDACCVELDEPHPAASAATTTRKSDPLRTFA